MRTHFSRVLFILQETVSFDLWNRQVSSHELLEICPWRYHDEGSFSA